MKIEIGSKFYENKNNLINKIKEGSLSIIEKKLSFSQCYFCSSPIRGRGLILISEEKEVDSFYFSHKSCYLFYKSLK
ncbi:MAG: hypothetical protein QW273_03125 [Candidatus Pacearchaeota archaeon]